MQTLAVVLKEPERLVLDRVGLAAPAAGDLVVDVEWSGISTGTERLLYRGEMPSFPGMGYPLVPGYESVGRVVEAGSGSPFRCGDRVFVPGSRGFTDVRGLFGGAAARLIVASERVAHVDESWGADAVLLALAATAYHALTLPGTTLPELIVGHGVLGRLMARMTIALGGAAPTVWERNADRRSGATGYAVIDPEAERRRDYRAIIDVSGHAPVLDRLVQHLAPGGEIVLAGFYAEPLSLTFPPAFMREARFRIAAEWRQPDLLATLDLLREGRLRLDGLVTHRCPAGDAPAAYETAFSDPTCLKMLLDWRTCP